MFLVWLSALVCTGAADIVRREAAVKHDIYDPTCGSGGMLIHSADYLRENGQNALAARYFGQEMNRSNFAIAEKF
jgi:type I restriction-modification system DNA methylase subunit